MHTRLPTTSVLFISNVVQDQKSSTCIKFIKKETTGQFSQNLHAVCEMQMQFSQ